MQSERCLSPGYGKDSQRIVRKNSSIVYYLTKKLKKKKTNLIHFSIDSGFNGTILRKMFKKLQLLVQPKPFNEIEYSLELERAMKHYNYTYDKLMYLMMQPCDQMLLKCAWLNRNRPCNEMFGISKTTKGYCCSFNTIDNLRYENWNLKVFFLLKMVYFLPLQPSKSKPTLCFWCGIFKLMNR